MDYGHLAPSFSMEALGPKNGGGVFFWFLMLSGGIANF